MESIGLFQLESLILARSPFLFLNLGLTEEAKWPAALTQILKTAEKVQPEEIKKRLDGEDKTRPIVLISQTDKSSSSVARELLATGFTNVYIIAGGVDGLLSELV